MLVATILLGLLITSGGAVLYLAWHNVKERPRRAIACMILAFGTIVTLFGFWSVSNTHADNDRFALRQITDQYGTRLTVVSLSTTRDQIRFFQQVHQWKYFNPPLDGVKAALEFDEQDCRAQLLTAENSPELWQIDWKHVKCHDDGIGIAYPLPPTKKQPAPAPPVKQVPPRPLPPTGPTTTGPLPA